MNDKPASESAEVVTSKGIGSSALLGSVVRFVLEGQRKQAPSSWSEIGGIYAKEEGVRKEEAEYREYMAAEKTGWTDFRVVRVTTTRELLPNTESREPEPSAHDRRTDAVEGSL